MATHTKKQARSQRPQTDKPPYGWKSIGELNRGDTLVISQQETVVQSIRQQEGNWWLTYMHPQTKSKTEEFYAANAYVFVRLP